MDGVIQDIKQGYEKEKKKKSRFASVEEEALESWIIKKRAEEMENELRTFIQMTYGASAWQDLELECKLKLEPDAHGGC